jgi:hypothetical protein
MSCIKTGDFITCLTTSDSATKRFLLNSSGHVDKQNAPPIVVASAYTVRVSDAATMAAHLQLIVLMALENRV